MKVIIAGGRNITDYNVVKIAYHKSGLQATEIVSGAAKGVDYLGELFAKNNGISIKRFPADWNKYGKRAGPLRNLEMAEYADALIAVWDGESKGTSNMIAQARQHGLIVFVYLVGEKYDTANSNH
jgi:glycerophosphoryl diester phosphodiesterase